MPMAPRNCRRTSRKLRATTSARIPINGTTKARMRPSFIRTGFTCENLNRRDASEPLAEQIIRPCLFPFEDAVGAILPGDLEQVHLPRFVRTGKHRLALCTLDDPALL